MRCRSLFPGVFVCFPCEVELKTIRKVERGGTVTTLLCFVLTLSLICNFT